MRIPLTFIFVLLGNVLLSLEVDSIDSSYRLYDFEREEMVDTSVQLRLVEVKKMIDRNDDGDEWITGPISGGSYSLGENYDSQQNINPKVAGLISISFLVFVVYIIFRVRRSLKKDKRNRRR